MFVRTINSAVLCFALTAGLLNAVSANAQSPTQNASNAAEYNTYVYTYSGRSMVLNLPTAIENQYNSATSSGQRAELSTEQFFAELLNLHISRAFKHATIALKQNDDDQWAPCLQDLNSAIYACDDLLNYQSGMSNPSAARQQAVQSCKFYLEIAADNCFEAAWGSWFWQPVIVGRP